MSPRWIAPLVHLAGKPAIGRDHRRACSRRPVRCSPSPRDGTAGPPSAAVDDPEAVDEIVRELLGRYPTACGHGRQGPRRMGGPLMTTTDERADHGVPRAGRVPAQGAVVPHRARAEARRARDDEAAPFEARVADVATQKAFQAALADAGLAGLTWPKPWGQGLTPEHQRVFNEEAAGYELPTTAYIIGLGMVIPTMIEFGTDAQMRALRRQGAAGRGDLVADVLRAGCRLRCRQPADARRARRRRMGPQRPEGLDHRRAALGLRSRHRPHEPGRSRSIAASRCSSWTSRRRVWKSGRCAR